MSFSKQWNCIYSNNTHMSIWPWSDLVSNFYRYAHPKNGFIKVLELGCGAGANIPLFLKEDCDYYAIEGSEKIIEKIIEKYPILSNKIIADDFTNKSNFFKEHFFDLVVDRGSITCNNTSAINNTLNCIFEYLRPGGKLICIDWYSTLHSDAKRGDYVDSHTRTNFPIDSHLHGIGQVHFSDREHILQLFNKVGLTIEKLEHKEKIQELPKSNVHFASWDIVAYKPT
ncbi:class I SAM-dependent methyltransferase [Aeromonas veronii]|uniref:class I SAM-dependent methyltransferase n=1 Tax=Aeromonas veronii TaxID=654 RepID=UPI000F5DBB6D|nr:methyltransferase domain-containing protein [Aeromonas veronii]MCX0421047.1 class I SAM-dependent methyltransferase [Aeromonas veronii]MCX0442576.1 class I SAM-dependent methyltransferase [Aeromonas veronii]RRA92102.1 methyltransferase domain-containing protein [Aeromonas veronii bv. sobria]TNI74422.1 hypothetical protein CF109_08410 [Aeromonas veronii]WIJ40861.1 methyltransferase domain-containing protein [Aeromonas veronii]